MSVLMHSIDKVRVKALRRVQRNIGAVETNIWEPVEEEQPAEGAGFDRFSLGTSLSRSTLTDLGSSLVHSDADTVSEALSVEEKSRTQFSERYNGDLLIASIHFLWKKKRLQYFQATDELISGPSNLTGCTNNGKRRSPASSQGH